jgi:hypothetical protein
LWRAHLAVFLVRTTVRRNGPTWLGSAADLLH